MSEYLKRAYSYLNSFESWQYGLVVVILLIIIIVSVCLTYQQTFQNIYLIPNKTFNIQKLTVPSPIEPSSDEPSSDEPSSDEPSSDEPSSDEPSAYDCADESCLYQIFKNKTINLNQIPDLVLIGPEPINNKIIKIDNRTLEQKMDSLSGIN